MGTFEKGNTVENKHAGNSHQGTNGRLRSLVMVTILFLAVVLIGTNAVPRLMVKGSAPAACQLVGGTWGTWTGSTCV